MVETVISPPEEKLIAMQAIVEWEWKLRTDRSIQLIPYVPKSQ
jgi:hypothetical protein